MLCNSVHHLFIYLCDTIIVILTENLISVQFISEASWADAMNHLGAHELIGTLCNKSI